MARSKASSAAPARAPQGILRFFTPLRAAPAPPPDAHASPTAEHTAATEQHTITETVAEPAPKADLEASEALPDKQANDSDDAQSDSDEALPAGASSQVSEYERKRLARVAQNAQFLRELGMKSAQMEVSGALQTGAKKPKQVKRPREKREESYGAGKRRSTRLRGIKLEEETVAPAEDQVEEEPAEPSFDDSSVFRYTCSGGHAGASARTDAQERPAGATLVGFRGTNQSLGDANLRRIYSVSFSPFQENTLIAAGGHQGQVSIYAGSSTPKDDSDDTSAPLMSFRGHRGWISSLSLAKSTVGKNLLLSAANDGVVKLWDLNRSAGGLPKELLSVDDLHRNGIFGMDVSGDDVLTCSKDSTIALSRFREDGSVLTVTRRYEDHDGVVKCARFSSLSPNRVASGGNDKCIRIYDTRSDATAASQTIENAHTRAINSVVWHPTQEHIVLSASFDPDMHLYDLRKPTGPLQVLSTSASRAAGTSIFHPCFVANGDFIVSTGAGSQDQLSLHRTLDGSTISRGELPGKSSFVTCDPFSGRLLVAMGQQLQFFEEEWRTA